MVGSPLIIWSVAIAAGMAAAMTDLRTGRIPNVLTGTLLLTGVIWAAVHGGAYLGSSMLGISVAGLPFFVLWLAGGTKAGDVKMMAALGAWLGASEAALALLTVALAGGLLSVVYAVYHQVEAVPETGPASSTRWRWTSRKLFVPYGPAIFAGVCAAAGWRLL